MATFIYSPPSGLPVLYEDRDIVIVDKPSGLLSIPGKEHRESALTRAEEVFGRLYSVHRLDMDTSGLLVFAKRRKSERHMHAQFRERAVKKEYVAVVSGHLYGSGDISEPLRRVGGMPPRSIVDRNKGRNALTHYRARPLLGGLSLVYLRPKTGRSHQLRVHLHHLGHPILGDRFYGGEANEVNRLHLHAAKLVFTHPYSQELFSIDSPNPLEWSSPKTRLMAQALQTHDLLLEPISMSDSTDLLTGFNNWNVIKNLSTAVPWPYPTNGMKSFIEKCLQEMQKGLRAVWTIKNKENLKPIGVIDVVHRKGSASPTRGFWLAEPYWGKGFMTQSVFAVQDFLFKELGLPDLFLKNAHNNRASARLKEKSGAEFIGYAEFEHHSGILKSDTWLLSREQWLVQRDSY